MRNMYSNYQRIKNGYSKKYYSQYDIIIEQEKIKKINERYDSYDLKLKAIADRYIKVCKQNIDFFCKQINQQIIENAKI